MNLIIDFILVAGIILNTMVLIGLFRSLQNDSSKKLLIIFWSFILLTIGHFYARLHDIKVLIQITYVFENGTRFLLAPLVYVYVLSVFNPRKTLDRKVLLHFVPFFLFFIAYTIPSLVYYTTDKTLCLYISTLNKMINWALVKDVYGVVYLSLALKVFKERRPILKDYVSTISEKNFLWISKFILLFLIAISIDLVITIVEISAGYNVEWDAYITVFFVIGAMVYLGYYGVTQTALFVTALPEVKSEPVSEVSAKSVWIQKEDAVALQTQLEVLFQKEEMHLNPNLSLRDLAGKLNVSTRKLSALLNDELHMTFYDKVNHHRVEAAKKMLTSDLVHQYTVSGIGSLCGFNSKSSFYRVFKKLEGVSPTEYKKAQA